MSNYIETTSEVLEVDPKNLKEFSAIDVFNNDNILNGVICRSSGQLYGTMIIYEINDKKVYPQIVYGTPKITYPFDKNGVFHWPEINEIKSWNKLDGTNILAYRYNIKNKRFVSYKTRLGPVVSDIGFGSFKSMWIEMLKEQEWIQKVIKDNPDYNLSFELYGSRNPITISYSTPLNVNLLFGIKKNGDIKPPSELKLDSNPLIPTEFEITKLDDLSSIYNKLRENMSNINAKSEDLLIEGMVLYAHVGEPSWKMVKCKPEEIEKIHWAASGVIPKREIWNTAINAFEDVEPSIDYLEELLLEEYTKKMILKSRIRIKNIFKEATEHMRIVKEVNKVWSIAKEKGFNIHENKDETMRFISKYFEKHQMKKIGTIILRQAGLIK